MAGNGFVLLGSGLEVLPRCTTIPGCNLSECEKVATSTPGNMAPSYSCRKFARSSLEACTFHDNETKMTALRIFRIRFTRFTPIQAAPDPPASLPQDQATASKHSIQ